MEADCFRYRDELEYMLSYALRLSGDNLVIGLMEAGASFLFFCRGRNMSRGCRTATPEGR